VTIRIGILGDFNPETPAHTTIGPSLQHAGRALEVDVESQWLATPSLVGTEGGRLLAGFDGLWAAPASPYQSMEGMLNGIEFARRRDWPFVGT
jgi:CTP synthase (UTP-ammonia lyase)